MIFAYEFYKTWLNTKKNHLLDKENILALSAGNNNSTGDPLRNYANIA